MLVKEKSLFTFFGVKEDDVHRSGKSPYYFMRDEIILPIRVDIQIGADIYFELDDSARDSGKRLTNYYKYIAEYYDDISIKLVLADFRIELVK